MKYCKLYLITKLIDVFLFPIELFYSDKRMVKLIQQRQKEWENYKVRLRK